MTCLQDCLMEPKRDFHRQHSLRQPSLMLCSAESFLGTADTSGLLWLTSQRPGGLALSRGDFSPHPTQVWCTVNKTSCSWKEQGAICSKVVHHLCLSKALSEMIVSSQGHETSDSLCKMETSFIWLCLIGG